MARRGENGQESAVVRRRRKRRARFIQKLVFAGAALTFLFSAASLILYETEKAHTEALNKELQEIHGAALRDSGAVLKSYTVDYTLEDAEREQKTNQESAQGWPGNPEMTVLEEFRDLQRRNQDIVGWLTIPDMVDQAVVLRDNSFYLKRDYLGYHNVNGALFLEEHTRLAERPNTYIIFGHNMKNGEMFGKLRLFENPSYYRKNPIVDFNVLYEKGRYVIFSAADVDIIGGAARYAPFMQLEQLQGRERERCIALLKRMSEIQTGIPVGPEDQLLLLVTCTGEDHIRHVVAARRLRPQEEETAVIGMAQGARKKS